MIPIDTRQLGGLEWKQPSAFQRQFELRSGDSVLARLHFVRMLGSSAVGEVVGSTWTLKRSGHFSTRASARIEGSTEDLITYEPNFTGTKGLFRLPGGETLQFRALNFWSSEWGLQDARGEMLLRFHLKGTLSTGADVEVAPEARELANLPLLLIVTWYVLVLHREDGAS